MHVLAHLEGFDLSFRPKTPTEFFALQVARRLDGLAHLFRYLEVAERYREDHILQALRSLTSKGAVGIELLEAELARIRNRISDE